MEVFMIDDVHKFHFILMALRKVTKPNDEKGTKW